MASISPEDWLLQSLRVAAVAIYGLVGWIVWHRRPSPEASLANRGFAVWWLGLAVLGLLAIPEGFGWTVADAGLTVWRIWVYVIFPIIYLALAGLLYYMLYLYTGRHGLYKPIIAFYAGLMVFLVWAVERGQPFTTQDETGTTVVEYAVEHAAWVPITWSILVLAPVLIAALAYGALFFRAPDRESRYRIGLVSGGIILWFSFSFISSIAGIGADASSSPFWHLVVSQTLGLAAAAMALLAFRPPAIIQRWIAGSPSAASGVA